MCQEQEYNIYITYSATVVFGSDALGLTLGWVGLRCVIWVQNTLNYSAPFQPVQAPRHVLAPMGHLVPRDFLFHFSTKSELPIKQQTSCKVVKKI